MTACPTLQLYFLQLHHHTVHTLSLSAPPEASFNHISVTTVLFLGCWSLAELFTFSHNSLLFLPPFSYSILKGCITNQRWSLSSLCLGLSVTQHELKPSFSYGALEDRHFHFPQFCCLLYNRIHVTDIVLCFSRGKSPKQAFWWAPSIHYCSLQEFPCLTCVKKAKDLTPTFLYAQISLGKITEWVGRGL